MAWCARRGPDFIEFQQARIGPGADRVQMSHGADAADGETRLRPHRRRVGAVQRLTRQCRGLGRIHLVAAGGQEQKALSAVMALENDRLHDLVQTTAHGIRRLLRGARAVSLAYVGGDARVFQRAAHAGHALAHA